MSFVSFILITGFNLGLASKSIKDEGGDLKKTVAEFNADKLTYVFSKSLFIWLFEATVLKGLFIAFNFGSPNYFELVAYTGYKFVILCLVMLG